MSKRTQRDPRRVYLAYVGLQSLGYALAATLQIVYQVEVIGLTPFQLVLVGTVLETTVFVFEVPTGVVADRFSRRLSMIIGCALTGIGFAIQGAVPELWAALTCSFVWGVGFTFISGAGQAWLVDEIGAANAQPAFTRARQVDLGVTIVGTLLACAIGLLGLGLPLVAAGATFLLAAMALALVMPERGFTPTPAEERETFTDMRASLKRGIAAIRRSRVVTMMVLIALFVGLSSEAVDRLWVDRILSDFTLPPVAGLDPLVVWFTAFALVGNLISLIVSITVNRLAHKAVNERHPNRLMAGLMATQVAGIAVLAVSPFAALALSGLWMREAARDLAYPIQMAWLNRNLEADSRATVLSMSSQVESLGQVVGGPSIGAVGSRIGVSAALMTSAAVLSPTIWLYRMLKRLRTDEPDTSGPSTVRAAT